MLLGGADDATHLPSPLPRLLVKPRITYLSSDIIINSVQIEVLRVMTIFQLAVS